MSTAMIWRAAPMRAPWMIERPTPPQPNTATVCPDDARALVPEDNRPVERKAADPVHDMQIAVAAAGRDGAHQHLAAPRPVDIDRLDRQRFLHLAKDRGLDLHRMILPRQSS